MSMEWLPALTSWLAGNTGWLAVALFATAFLESLALAGILIPGVAIIFAVALLAGQTAMPLHQALIWAGMGAIAGDCVSFALGRLCQGKLHTIWPLSRYPSIIDKGERFFGKHGGKSVVMGRFIGPVRPVIPLIAGALMMPWRRFLLFNLSSAVGWAPAYVLPGYLVGSAFATGFSPPAHFYPVVGVSLAILAAVYFILFRIQLGLGYNSRSYQWLAYKMANYQAARRFWRLYSSERPSQAGEFPLSSLCLGLGCAALFMIWGQLATATSLLQPFDRLVMSWFIELRHPVLDVPFLFLTLLGDPPVLITAAILIGLTLLFRGYYAAILHIAAAVGLTSVLVWFFKSWTAVPRPDEVLLPPSSFAFPSGHTAGITVFCALTASFVAREVRQIKRWRIYLLFSVPIVLVAISRLYLAVHWFTDLVGGVLLGLAVTGLIRASFSRYDRVPLPPDISTAIAFALWAIFTGTYIASRWSSAMVTYSFAPA